VKSKEPIKCLEQAYRLLARRDHGRNELVQKLVARGFDNGQIENAVEELASRGYIDDKKLCPVYANARVKKLLLGPMKLRHDLQAKGFDISLAEQVVSEIFCDDEATLDIAKKSAGKKLRTLPDADESEQKQKVFRHLTNRGFDNDTARRVVLDMWQLL